MCDVAGVEIARGLVNYGADDLRRILGQHSADIAETLGYDYGPEFIHATSWCAVNRSLGGSLWICA
jgi:glutamate 5-kinase